MRHKSTICLHFFKSKKECQDQTVEETPAQNATTTTTTTTTTNTETFQMPCAECLVKEKYGWVDGFCFENEILEQMYILQLKYLKVCVYGKTLNEGKIPLFWNDCDISCPYLN